MQAGLKVSGCPTTPKLYFSTESGIAGRGVKNEKNPAPRTAAGLRK